ncbi:MAG: hypothetical protein J0L67_01285 [Cytophagales bacterium]|nr:hypothetical protein [Cytophagales bacterium]
MVKLLIWIRTHWAIVIAIVGVLIAIDISITIWVFKDFDLVISHKAAEYFSNLMTPIAAIISVILFLFAIKQTSSQAKFIERQHEREESDHAKEGLNQEYQMIEEELKEDFAKYILNGVGLANNLKMEEKYENLKINSLDYIPFLRSEISDLVKSQDYSLDEIDDVNRVEHQRAHYVSRDYARTLKAINQICLFVDHKYKRIGYLLDRVEVSKLTPDERILFRRKIEVNWIRDYLNFMKFNASTRIPDLRKATSHEAIDWIQINETSLGDFLRKYGSYFD